MNRVVAMILAMIFYLKLLESIKSMATGTAATGGMWVLLSLTGRPIWI